MSTTEEPKTTPAAPATPPVVEPSSTPVSKLTIKTANKPFLVHQRFLAKQKAEKAEALARKERGEPPLVPPTNFLLNALKWTLIALLTSAFLSRSVTGSWNWGYEGKYAHWDNIKDLVFPPKQLILSESQLALHDGTDPKYPLWLGIDGEVYDVSSSAKTYGPGGSYHFFTGRDVSRAYVTGCFKTHLTHDIRGFTEVEMAGLEHWKSFFKNHERYKHIGRVVHEPIDPSSPIPPPCNDVKK